MANADALTRAAAAKTPVPAFDGTPFTAPPPLREATVAIVTTGGLRRAGQTDWSRGEQSFRVLDAADRDLIMGHWSLNFDRSGFSADLNVLYPIDRLAELAAAGTIGAVAAHHLSFMGALDDTMSSIRLDAGPAAAKQLLDDGVDVVLLTGV